MPEDLANTELSSNRGDADPAGPVDAYNDVSISFDGKPVLETISFTVQRAETRIILGPAG